jgi:hypothetical protein
VLICRARALPAHGVFQIKDEDGRDKSGHDEPTREVKTKVSARAAKSARSRPQQR